MDMPSSFLHISDSNLLEPVFLLHFVVRSGPKHDRLRRMYTDKIAIWC
jgi:hypothetical protein